MAALMLIGLIAAGSSGATTVQTPDFTATATATVAPTRLPKDGTAPVTLTVNSMGTRPDPAALSAYPMHSVGLRLDRQITVDTEALPTCSKADLKFVTPSQARRKCGQALIGSGGADVTLPSGYDDGVIFNRHFDLLFFNAPHAGVLMYRSYTLLPEAGIAWPAGTLSLLRLKDVGGEDSRIVLSSFQIRFGKTWRSKGKRHSYLNGSCSTGSFKNAITLGLDSGQVSETTPQRCTKRSG